MHPLSEKVLSRDVRGTARACRFVDDRHGDYLTILKELFPHTGRAWMLGVTGNPGAGKSTLVDRMIAAFRARGLRVAVVAIDPTRPFSGGAILGDRIRMQEHSADLGPALEQAVDAVDARSLDPYTAAEDLVAAFRADTAG